MACKPMKVEVNGTVHRVTVERDPSAAQRLRVAWGEIEHFIDARQLDAQTLSLVGVGADSGSLEARVVGSGSHGELDVTIDGVLVRATVDTGRTFLGGQTGDGSQGPHEVVAPMPGKVVRVLVQEGDVVDAKQSIVVVEAMKMENELTTPRAGSVRRVPVSEGTSVDAGTVLVVIE